MSDPMVPGEGSTDATPTESLELPDRQPVGFGPQGAAAAAPSPGSHTRTILEVIGGVVAAALIVVAGAAGFVVGQATGSDDDGRWGMTGSHQRLGEGPDAGGPLGGLGRDDDAGGYGDKRQGPGRDGRQGPGRDGRGGPGQDGPGSPGQGAPFGQPGAGPTAG